jgi:hypothetical protein
MAANAREWTAEILILGSTLYAWFAFDPKWDTFATELSEHARMFESEADVDAWIERLKVPNATAVRIRAGKVVRPQTLTPKGGVGDGRQETKAKGSPSARGRARA